MSCASRRAARVPDINKGLYRTFFQPNVRLLANEPLAEFQRRLHPNRVRFDLFADDNPLMQVVAAWAEMARACGQCVSLENPLLALQQMASDLIVTLLDSWTWARNALEERVFLNVYGTPLLQAAVGLLGEEPVTRRQAARRIPLSVLKELIKDQFLLLRHDEEQAVASIPELQLTIARDVLNRLMPYTDSCRHVARWTTNGSSGCPGSRRCLAARRRNACLSRCGPGDVVLTLRSRVIASEAQQSLVIGPMSLSHDEDCFVAVLLAMTLRPGIIRQSRITRIHRREAPGRRALMNEVLRQHMPRHGK